MEAVDEAITAVWERLLIPIRSMTHTVSVY